MANILFRSAMDDLASDPQRSQEFIVGLDTGTIFSNYGSELSEIGVNRKDLEDVRILIKSGDEPGISVDYQDSHWFGYQSGYATQTKFIRDFGCTVQLLEDNAARKFFLWWNQKTQQSEVLRIEDATAGSTIGSTSTNVFPSTHISGLGTQKAGGNNGIIKNDGLLYLNTYSWDSRSLGDRDSTNEDITSRPLYRLNFINATVANVGSVTHSHSQPGLSTFQVSFHVDAYYWIFRRTPLRFANT